MNLLPPLRALAALGSVVLSSSTAPADTTFADQAQLIALNRSAGSVAPCDIDSDGDTDLLVFAAGVLVYLNEGGSLAPPVVVSDLRPDALGDLNGDGFPDLVASERISPISISRRYYTLLNDGTGRGFTRDGSSFAQTRDRMQPPADVDGDGDLDLIQLDTPDRFYWYENTDGTGGFGPREELFSSADLQFSSGTSLGDINGDGMADLFAGEDAGAAVLLQIAPDGRARRFAAPTLVAPGGSPVKLGHFNDDAHLDLFAILSPAGDAGFLLGNGDGEFTSGAASPGGVFPFDGRIVDWEGDGDFDLITKGFFEAVELYIQVGGKLTGPVELLPGVVDFEVYTLADIDGDGRADIGTARGDGDFDFAIQNTSGNTFLPLQTLLSSLGSLTDLGAARLNGDSRPDLVTANVSDVLSVLRSEGERGFGTIETVATSESTEFDSAFGSADFDGVDGDDLIQWDSDSGSLKLLLNDGTGKFAAPLPIGTQTGSGAAFETGDFNRDLRMDFAVVSSAPPRVILYLQSAVTPLTFAATTIGGTMSSPECLNASDLDLDGNLDLLVGGYNGSDGEVGLVDNLGSGVFAAMSPLFTHTGPVSQIRSANLNPGTDTDIDLIVLENSGTHSTTTVFENTGGTFAATQEIFSRSASGWTFETGDLDQDGDTDIALAGSAGAGDVRIEWFENDGSGALGPAVTVSRDTTAKRSEILLVDIDADGDLDIATGDLNTGRIEWFENQFGEGPLERWAKPLGATDLDPLSDEDGDGHSLVEEYAFNLHPLKPESGVVEPAGTSGLPYIRLYQTGNRTRVDYRVIRRADADNGLTYTLQTSTDLVEWDDTDLGGGSSTSDPNYRRVTVDRLTVRTSQTPAHAARIKVNYTAQ